ncbi:antibiotic biosynthesis monooxygenase [Streptomyces sp. 3MP-14]|uniref:Antibiotic biosynthesis monooxygenase n=1 Tax=Streptomyces mimosae TaxID=2586635 RepID=A0A5N6APS9_9ACTN|nr:MULTISPECIES: antibiotic biosynthesis monooxygenase family protein [Streptomyces]KAB8169920.1 antibiotic biosynthesis monooxygenase [Streptomyces mimosae]KAB8178668.1 antibiotic biosynthesis monooxygenase [Streptomyces sp. 3MP-14]
MATLINKFTVVGDVETFRTALAHVSEYMQAQPGFISHELYQSLSKPEIFVETATWDHADSHKKAVSSDEFRNRVKGLAGLAKPDADLYRSVDDH